MTESIERPNRVNHDWRKEISWLVFPELLVRVQLVSSEKVVFILFTGFRQVWSFWLNSIEGNLLLNAMPPRSWCGSQQNLLAVILTRRLLQHKDPHLRAIHPLPPKPRLSTSQILPIRQSIKSSCGTGSISLFERRLFCMNNKEMRGGWFRRLRLPWPTNNPKK